jgi:hypothetical protein
LIVDLDRLIHRCFCHCSISMLKCDPFHRQARPCALRSEEKETRPRRKVGIRRDVSVLLRQTGTFHDDGARELRRHAGGRVGPLYDLQPQDRIPDADLAQGQPGARLEALRLTPVSRRARRSGPRLAG